MAIIRQKNRTNGIEYVFLSVSRRVPDKKWPVSERTSLGHFDLDGDFVPSSYFLSLDEQQQLATGLVVEPFVRRTGGSAALVRKRCGLLVSKLFWSEFLQLFSVEFPQTILELIFAWCFGVATDGRSISNKPCGSTGNPGHPRGARVSNPFCTDAVVTPQDAA